MIVFLPVTADSLTTLRGSPEDRVGYTATPALLGQLDLVDADEEEADFAAFSCAAVAALLDGEGARFVVAADVPAGSCTPVPDDPFGRVALSGPPWRQILAVYTDEVSALAAISVARRALAGLALDQAWRHPTVERLRVEHDLLWHTPDELVPAT